MNDILPISGVLILASRLQYGEHRQEQQNNDSQDKRNQHIEDIEGEAVEEDSPLGNAHCHFQCGKQTAKDVRNQCEEHTAYDIDLKCIISFEYADPSDNRQNASDDCQNQRNVVTGKILFHNNYLLYVSVGLLSFDDLIIPENIDENKDASGFLTTDFINVENGKTAPGKYILTR